VKNEIPHHVERLTAVVCSVVLIPGTVPLTRSEPIRSKRARPLKRLQNPNDQLDARFRQSLSIPGPAFGASLGGSTYPLEIVQLQHGSSKIRI